MFNSAPHSPLGPALRDSYAWCCKITRQRARNFYFAIRLLPRPRRQAMCAVYAFFRECDDISDAKNVCNRQERLQYWQRIIEGEEPSTFMPGLLALRHTVALYKIEPRYFLELIEGTMMDLQEIHFQTFEQLYKYCYHVASTVGLVCISIFGAKDDPRVRQMAEFHGVAFQLTNILRDIDQDAREGRVYLPDEILAQFQITRQSILNRTYNPSKMAPLIAHLAQIAESYYQRSRDLPLYIAPPSRTCLRAMTNIYHGILKKIERLGPQSLQQKARLSLWEKLRAIAAAYLVTWGEFLRQLFTNRHA